MQESELERKLNDEAKTKSRIDIIKAVVTKIKNDNYNERRLNLNEVDYSKLDDCFD